MFLAGTRIVRAGRPWRVKMSTKMFGTTFQAGILTLAVMGLAAPTFAQTNPNSATGMLGVPDIRAQELQQQRGLQRQNRAPRTTTGSAVGWETPQDSDTGSKAGQPGAGVPAILPGGPSGAPANPCTPALKAQDRC